MKSNGWKKSGWRSLLHRGYPKCVVRFSGARGKIKLLCNEREFNSGELAAGRIPHDTLKALEQQAENVWRELNDENRV